MTASADLFAELLRRYQSASGDLDCRTPVECSQEPECFLCRCRAATTPAASAASTREQALEKALRDYHRAHAANPVVLHYDAADMAPICACEGCLAARAALAMPRKEASDQAEVPTREEGLTEALSEIRRVARGVLDDGDDSASACEVILDFADDALALPASKAVRS